MRNLRICTSVPCVNTGIVAALVAAARDSRKAEGISAEKMAVALERTGAGSKSKVSRFEKMEHYGEIDRVLNTYAEVLDISLMDLLKAAEERLPKSARQRRTPPSKAAAARRAKRVAKQAREDTQRSHGQSADTPPSKAKKRQAG